MCGYSNCSLALVLLLALLNCEINRCIGLDNAAGDSTCALRVARKSIPFCHSALYDVNMKAREFSRSPRQTFCCSLHGLEKCLRSAFAYFSCTSEKIIQEDFVHLITESINNGDMTLDGPCEDFEDDVSCQAEISAFDDAVVAFTKVFPVRPDVIPEASKPSNRQPRLEPLNSTLNSTVNQMQAFNVTSNSTETDNGCSSSRNLNSTACSKPVTDTERTQRAYLEWESSKQLVVIVTDEQGEKLVLTVNKKGSGYLVKTQQADPDSGNDLLEWREITKVIGVLPKVGNSSAVVVSNAKEDGTMVYGGPFKEHANVIPDKLISFMLKHINSTRNHTSMANMDNHEDEHKHESHRHPIVHHEHPIVHHEEHAAANRTPRYLDSPKSRPVWSDNVTNFVKTVNDSWFNMLNSSAGLGLNDTRTLRSIQSHSNGTIIETGGNDTSVAERKDHSRALFSQATLPPFPEEPSMGNITDPQEYQVMFFGFWPDNSSNLASLNRPPAVALPTNSSNALAQGNLFGVNFQTANLSRLARLIEESGGNFSSNETAADKRVPKAQTAAETNATDIHSKLNQTATNSSFLNENKTGNWKLQPKPKSLVSSTNNSLEFVNATSNSTERIPRFGGTWEGNSTSTNHSKVEERRPRNKVSSLNSSEEYQHSKGNNISEWKLEHTKDYNSKSNLSSDFNHTQHNTTGREPKSQVTEDRNATVHNHSDTTEVREARGKLSLSNNYTSDYSNDTRNNATERRPKFALSENNSSNGQHVNTSEINVFSGNKSLTNESFSTDRQARLKVLSENGTWDLNTTNTENRTAATSGERQARLQSMNQTLLANKTGVDNSLNDTNSGSKPPSNVRISRFSSSSNETGYINSTSSFNESSLNPAPKQARSNSMEDVNSPEHLNATSSENSTSEINEVHHVSRREAVWSRASRLLTSLFTLGEMDIKFNS